MRRLEAAVFSMQGESWKKSERFDTMWGVSSYFALSL
jgi:hypothetical protein